MHEYWSQFGGDHVTEAPVEIWLQEFTTLNGPVLWQGMFHDRHFVLEWDDTSKSMIVESDGIALDVEMLEAARPTWRAKESELEGMIDVDEANAQIILQLVSNGVARRFYAQYGNGGVAGDEGPSTCVCFGEGTATMACMPSGCDTGATCGSTRRCRWKSGSNSPMP